MSRKATAGQRVGLTTAAMVVGHGVMNLYHGGPVGAILATGLGVAAWMFADEVFEQINDGGEQPASSPDDAAARKRKMHRLFFGGGGHRDSVSHEEEEEGDGDLRRGGTYDEAQEPDEAWDEQSLASLDTADQGCKTFRQLLEDGTIVSALKRGEMVLGYVDGELRTMKIKQLYSCGIGGLSGTGKSTTVRLLLFQFALLSARLVMIDPHIGDKEESLAESFKGFTSIHALPPCGEETKEIERRVDILMREYHRRKNNGVKGPPLILVIDELNGLMRRLPSELRIALSELILTLEGEARKFGMFCLLIGQRWSEQDLGGKPHGAAIRDSLASTIAHRFQSEDQAKKLIGSQYARACLALRNGNYLFRDTDGEVVQVYTPNTLASDAVLVQQHLDRWQAPKRTRAMERAEPEETRSGGSAPFTLEMINEWYQSNLIDQDTMMRLLSRLEEQKEEQPEEVTQWDRAKDHIVMPAQTTETGPLEEATLPPKVEKKLRSDDLHIDTLVASWNVGINTVSKIEAFFKMSHGEAYKAYKRVKAQVGESVDE